MGKAGKQIYSKGFALPTVLIASLAMMIVLLSSLVAVSGTNVTIRSQIYDQLAQEAAEAGVNLMVGCVQDNTTFPSSGVYSPGSTSCANTTNARSACLSTSLGSSNDVKYVTTFEANRPVTSGDYYNVKAVGKVHVYRNSSAPTSCGTSVPGGAVKTYTKNLDLRIRNEYLSSGASVASSGSLFVCTISRGETYCWGNNQVGQMGNGYVDSTDAYWANGADAETFTDNVNEKVPAKARVKRIFNPDCTDPNGLCGQEIDVAAGLGFACAITTASDYPVGDPGEEASRRVACWGENKFDQLAIRSGRSPIKTTSNGNIYAPGWTKDPWRGGTDPPQIPVQIEVASSTVCVRTKKTSSSDLRSNVWCWGANGNGQVGNNVQQATWDTPQAVVGIGSNTTIQMTDINLTAGAAGQVCGIQNGSYIVCWGNNQYGQLGNGQYTLSRRPVRVLIQGTNEFLRGSTVTVGGQFSDDGTDESAHSCAIASNDDPTFGIKGKVYCWGANTFRGEVCADGDPNASKCSNATIPRARIINSIGNSSYIATKVAAAAQTVCASVRLNGSTNGRVYCWGSNESGEIGSGGTAAFGYGPTPIALSGNVDDLNGGAFRFCAVQKGRVYCWGRDQVGQIGDGRARDQNNNVGYENTPKRSRFSESFDGVIF